MCEVVAGEERDRGGKYWRQMSNSSFLHLVIVRAVIEGQRRFHNHYYALVVRRWACREEGGRGAGNS